MFTISFWKTHNLPLQINLLDLIAFLEKNHSLKNCSQLLIRIKHVLNQTSYTESQLLKVNAFDALTYSGFDAQTTNWQHFFNIKFPRILSYFIEETEIIKQANVPNTETDSGPNVYHQANNNIHQQILTFSKDLDQLITRELLLDKSWHNTPLVLACKIGNTKAALKLLKSHQVHQVDVNEADKNGMTPLHWACFFRDDLLIEALIKSGANNNILNNNNLTPLDLYQLELPADLRIGNKSSPKGIYGIKYIPQIKESSNFFIANEQLNCCLDIIFHMDKIAYHQLDIDEEQLLLQKQKFPALSSSNAHFEIYLFFYFYAFIRERNLKPISMTLIEKLTPDIKYNEALPTHGIASSSDTPKYTIFSHLYNYLIDLINWLSSLIMGQQSEMHYLMRTP